MTPFFELLQVALGRLEGLSRVPSVLEWEEVYEEAERQAVVGVMFNGIEKLQRLADSDERLADCMPPLDLKLEWIGEVMQMEDEYRTHCERAAELTRRFQGVGVESCVLKGVGVAQYYPTPARRQCGDIDLWVRKGERLAVRGERLAGRDEGVEGSGEGFRKSLMKWLRSQYEIGHNVWHNVGVEVFEDMQVEVHFHPGWLWNPWHNRHLQRFFEFESHELVKSDIGFNVPRLEFDAVFSLVHTYRHLIAGGIGLRHVVDYYYMLKKCHTDRTDCTDFLRMLRSIGMGKFAGAMMWVMKEVCGVADEMLICEPNEKEGKFLLNEIMAGGNFGQSRQDGKVRNSFSRWWMMVKHYPSEVLWMIPWKVWHRGWRAFHKV